MKSKLLIILGCLFCPSVFAGEFKAITQQVITLEDVVTKISTENYQVLQNALRVYQAKEGIEVARANLLPRLNLWKIANLSIDVVMGLSTYQYGAVANSALGMTEDIAPFLVPANWFRLKENEILFLAEKEAYRALWANELMTAKSLYFHSLMDRSVLEHIEQNIREFKDLYTVLKSRVDLGGLPPEPARDVEARLLSLYEDKRSLEVVINEEDTLLSYMMGLPAKTDLIITPVLLPDFGQFETLRFEDFEFRVVDVSPEVRQYAHIIEAADYVRDEVVYSFLGSSSAMRGTQGGVFDGLPLQMGLGFGTGASLRIVAAQREALKIQQKAAAETVARQLKLLINNYNLDLLNYPDLKRHVELTSSIMDRLNERLNLGENLDILMLVEASRNHIQAQTALFSAQFRFLVNEDRLKRLIFQGDYIKIPATLEIIKTPKS